MEDERNLIKWQWRLLPWAIGMLIVLAAFFFISSWIQFDRLSASISISHDHPMAEVFDEFEDSNDTQNLDYLNWKSRVLLEERVVELRYRQVNATMMLRAWTRHLGFLVGMILSFIGGIFILAKLSEGTSTLRAGTGSIKGALETSSPGIVLTVVGGALMSITLLTEYQFSTRDLAAYVGQPEIDRELPNSLPELTDETARREEEAALFAGEITGE